VPAQKTFLFRKLAQKSLQAALQESVEFRGTHRILILHQALRDGPFTKRPLEIETDLLHGMEESFDGRPVENELFKKLPFAASLRWSRTTLGGARGVRRPCSGDRKAPGGSKSSYIARHHGVRPALSLARREADRWAAQTAVKKWTFSGATTATGWGWRGGA
jgi:hypothetical protein